MASSQRQAPETHAAGGRGRRLPTGYASGRRIQSLTLARTPIAIVCSRVDRSWRRNRTLGFGDHQHQVTHEYAPLRRGFGIEAPGFHSGRASSRADGARGARLHSGLTRRRPTTGGGRE
jgi:hypothetical protein